MAVTVPQYDPLKVNQSLNRIKTIFIFCFVDGAPQDKRNKDVHGDLNNPITCHVTGGYIVADNVYIHVPLNLNGASKGMYVMWKRK